MDKVNILVQNPVSLIRERLGKISRAELAKRTGCGYGILSHAELGYDPQLPPSVLDALEREGLSRDESTRLYAEWREHVKDTLRAA